MIFFNWFEEFHIRSGIFKLSPALCWIQILRHKAPADFKYISDLREKYELSILGTIETVNKSCSIQIVIFRLPDLDLFKRRIKC